MIDQDLSKIIAQYKRKKGLSKLYRKVELYSGG